MECLDLGIIDELIKKYMFIIAHYILLVELLQNYHFWIKIVTKMAINGQ